LDGLEEKGNLEIETKIFSKVIKNNSIIFFVKFADKAL
jgi:hypothetical protein